MDSPIRISILLCLTLGVIAAADDTPVLLWSSEPLINEFPEVENLDSVPTTAFHDEYLSPLLKNSKHSVVAFLQDKLHVDDFTKYADVYSANSEGGAFKNIKQLMEDNFSLEIPQVIKPHLALDKLKESFAGNFHSINSLEELGPLHLSNGKQFLLVVNLNSLTNAIDMEKAISQNDDIIGSVARHLQKIGVKYTALFTGKSSVDNQVEEIEVHTGRHLLADDEGSSDSSGVFMNVTGEIFVYLRPNVTVCVKNGLTACDILLVMPPLNTTADSSTKANNTADVVLEFENVPSKWNSSDVTYNVSITFHLKNESFRWIMERTTLSVKRGTNVTVEAELKTYGVDLTIPKPYSFHCTDYMLTVTNQSSPHVGTFVRLTGFQLQAFNIQDDSFFNAQDCVGFFTTGIWMGLFPTAILLLILIAGTMMLLNLSVTDRFDDPKKKTITVSATE